MGEILKGTRNYHEKGKNRKTPLFTTRSLLSLEAQRAQRIELDRIDRIFLNLDCWIA